VTSGQAPRPRKPSHAPTRSDLEERDRYAKLTADSAATVRSSAQAWRNGLTAFITLVTTAVVFQGRETTTGLAAGWRAAITILICGGLLLAVLGLWQALAAEAGTDPELQTLQDIRTTHGTLDAYQVYLAASAARRLQWGRRAVLGAIITLLTGIALALLAPSSGSPPSADITIAHGNAITYSQLRAAGTSGLRRAIRAVPISLLSSSPRSPALPGPLAARRQQRRRTCRQAPSPIQIIRISHNSVPFYYRSLARKTATPAQVS
jgi:hypothetical protein